MATAMKQRTIENIADLVDLVSAKDRLYIDLDDTLMRTEPDASGLFEAAMKRALEERGVDAVDARMTSCVLWQGMQKDCDVGTVEPACTRETLEVLHSQGTEIIGLTARCPRIIVETISQLKRCNILSFFNHHESLGEIAQSAPGDPRPSIVHNRGIIYCTGSRKPQAILAYEQNRPKADARIVMVDDLKAHVDAIGVTLSNREYLGLHYRFLCGRQTYSLPRLGVRFAAMLADPQGRGFLLQAIQRLDASVKTRNISKTQSSITLSTMTVALAAFVTGTVVTIFAIRFFDKRKS